MAHLSLYRKYRIQTFDELIGQDHVARTLANAIAEDRVAHAYLFTGPRGTGKTSTARILAKALNCVQGPTPTPCGVCESCVAIAQGSSMDVIEMDAASHSKVDETREILAGVPLATAGARKKVYVIDEVHMLSVPSFNALLKTLEEPPAHVVFVLATTEAHKVLPTIVSRTQRFDFRRVPAELIEAHLAKVAELEDIDVERDALGVVARHADGGVRDALSTLDQLASLEGRVTVDDVAALLGGRREDALAELFDAVAAGDVGGVFGALHTLVAEGGDPRQLALGALDHARSLLLVKAAPDAESLLDVSREDIPRLLEQSGRFSGGDLMRMLDLLGKALTEMRNVPDHRLLLEVALVRAAAPETDPSATGLLGRIERLERRMGIAEHAEQPRGDPRRSAPPAGADADATRPADVARPTDTTGDAADAVEPPARAAEPAPVAGAAARAEEPAPTPVTSTEQVGLADIRDAWQAVLKEVASRGRKVAALLTPSRALRLEDGVLTVEVQARFHADNMARPGERGLLGDALHAVLGIRPDLASEARQARSSGPPAAEPDLSDTTPLRPDEHDPVELLKKGFKAEVVEETENVDA